VSNIARANIKIVAGRDMDAPTFTASALEKLTIKRFLDFAIRDAVFQSQEALAEMSLPISINAATVRKWKADVEALHAQRDLIVEYVKALREGVDTMTPQIDFTQEDGA